MTSHLHAAPLCFGNPASDAVFWNVDSPGLRGSFAPSTAEVCGCSNLTALSFICIMDAFLSIMQMVWEGN